MIGFNYLEGGGHRIKLPDGPSFAEPESGMKLGEWIDLVIEYKKGEITIGVNGYSKTYKNEAVTIINEKDKLGPRFTFKGGPNCQIVFVDPSLEMRRVTASGFFPDTKTALSTSLMSVLNKAGETWLTDAFYRPLYARR